MGLEDKIIAEFDSKTRVLYLSAAEKLYCTAESELEELCDCVRGIIMKTRAKSEST